MTDEERAVAIRYHEDAYRRTTRSFGGGEYIGDEAKAHLEALIALRTTTV